jgi:putative tricarboxylic transport membrane protein
VIGSFYVGNLMLLVLNLPLVGLFARVATIPPRYLMPVVLVLCAVGAFADNNNLFDVWVMVAAGLLGYVMRLLDYDPAPLVLGLVLGPVMERSLVQALTIARGEVSGLWESPLSAGLLLAAGATVLISLLTAAWPARRARRSAGGEPPAAA